MYTLFMKILLREASISCMYTVIEMRHCLIFVCVDLECGCISAGGSVLFSGLCSVLPFG